MARRGENIYKRKDNRWEGRYIKSRGAGGRIGYGYVYGKTYGAVKARLLPLKSLYGSCIGELTGFGGTLGDWAVCCMAEIAASDIKESTYAYYNGILRKHILPALGERKLSGLTKKELQCFVDALSRNGLGAGACSGVFGLLNRFLKYAVQRGALLVNPASNIRLPKRVKPQIRALDLAGQKQLEQIALADPDGLPVILALYTGMRIGEICALRWSDVNLQTGMIQVRQTVQRIACSGGSHKTKIVFGAPKSEQSNRLIPIPDRLCAFLKRSREQSKSDYVVSCKGSFAEPRVVRQRYYRIRERAGIQPVHFHALRHTFATRCMELRFDVTTLSRLLGHSSVKMTLDIYTDSLLEHKIIAMHMLDQVFSMKAAM